MTVFLPARARPVDDSLRPLLEVLLPIRPEADAGLIRRAYDVAAYWHRGQSRMSGAEYITHPFAVATIPARLGADDATLCAALLHDTIEDTPFTLAALRREFGSEIATLVQGVTALDRLKARRGRAAARVLAVVRPADVRVLRIKLADRLHNMQTLQFIPQPKQLRKAQEAIDVFVPVAQQLNLDAIKLELEALASDTLKRNRHTRSCGSARSCMPERSATTPMAATAKRWTSRSACSMPRRSRRRSARRPIR